MNSLLENPADTEAICVPDAVAAVTGASRGAALLLEDDVSFRAVITDVLTEAGYTVVAVRNGAEGIREVMRRDFTVILCDMMMPTMPGEMFYRAVERTRPHLCQRFIFMTGYRNDSKTSAFIDNVGGYVIRKPFPLQDLLDSVALAEVRSTYSSVWDSGPLEPHPAPGLLPVETDLGHVEPSPEEPEMAETVLESDPSIRVPPVAGAPVLSDEPQRRVEELETPLPPTPATAILRAAAAASEAGRVLLVDDDPGFNDIIRDFLVESGFTVVAVKSGGDAVREVLAGDFALVLCDVMMPSLPGDVFYRAVERIRPELCERFVFMSGYRGDEKTCDFIKRVNGYLLRKPFALQDLLDAITISQARSEVSKTPRSTTAAPLSSPARPPADPPVRQPGSWGMDEPAAPAPYRLRGAETAEPSFSASGLFRSLVFGAVALVVVLIVNLGIRSPRARVEAAAASSERRELEAKWEVVSRQQVQAVEAANANTSLQQRAASLAVESKGGGWTEALRVISIAAGSGIALESIASHGVEGSRGGCKVLIQGSAIGSAPRAIAGAFHSALRREAERSLAGAVVTHLDKLEDEPGGASAPPDRRRASFKITLTVGSDKTRSKKSGVAK